jgi:hypothetical protein
MLKILNWRMSRWKRNGSFRKKTAPPIEGGALLNEGKITRIAIKASFNCTILFFS